MTAQKPQDLSGMAVSPDDAAAHGEHQQELVIGKVVDGDAAIAALQVPMGNVVTAQDDSHEAVSHRGFGQQETPLVFYGRLVFLLTLLVVLVWLIIRELPRFMDFVVDVTSPISENKDEPLTIFIVALFFMYFCTIPSLGKQAWFLVMSHIYKWWCAIFILTAHVLGSSIDFMFGKWIRKRIDRDPSFCSWCCCCNGGSSTARFCDKCFQCSQIQMYIKAMKVPIKERPFRLVLLLILMPSPSSMTAGLIGGYVDDLTLVEFIVPWSIGGLKFARDVYIGTKVSDLASYIRGDSEVDVVDTAFTIISIVLLTTIGGYLMHYAHQKVKRTYLEQTAEMGPTAYSV